VTMDSLIWSSIFTLSFPATVTMRTASGAPFLNALTLRVPTLTETSPGRGDSPTLTPSTRMSAPVTFVEIRNWAILSSSFANISSTWARRSAGSRLYLRPCIA